MSQKHPVIASLVQVFVVLAVGIGVMMGLVKTKEKPKQKPRIDRGTVVETVQAKIGPSAVVIEGHGIVQPARRVVVSSEVAGRVKWLKPGLTKGDLIQKGTKLINIDASEYLAALSQQQAQVDRAATELQLERSRKQIAEKEWEIVGGKQPKDDDSLALRGPQLRTAKVALKSARSGRHRAWLNVSRTKLSAPFNAVVQDKQVDIGQLVGPATALLTLAGTDRYWVQVSLPVSRIPWIDVPGIAGAKEGATATVFQTIGEQQYQYAGRVVRMLPDVDPVGRMARLLIAIDDPRGLKRKDGASAPPVPLLLGRYVNVAIQGRQADSVAEIPREALRNGNQVYIMSGDDTLITKKVTILWRKRETVLVRDGVATGDRLIVSPVPGAVEGMKLRQRQETASDRQNDTVSPKVDDKAARKRPSELPPVPGPPATGGSVDKPKSASVKQP